jgi:hypothetical protein
MHFAASLAASSAMETLAKICSAQLSLHAAWAGRSRMPGNHAYPKLVVLVL